MKKSEMIDIIAELLSTQSKYAGSNPSEHLKFAKRLLEVMEEEGMVMLGKYDEVFRWENMNGELLKIFIKVDNIGWEE